MTSVLDIPIAITIFPDKQAREWDGYIADLRLLARQIEHMNADRKEDLPLLKLARFGTQPTEKGCMRHAGNMISITGIEGDYDGEQISIDEAAARLRTHGIAAIIATSPSYTEDSPRWRVLAPTSEELPFDLRAPLVSRLNGALGGILNGESWTPAQSFYLGKVRQNPSHRAELIDGTAIDLMPELDKLAIGKDGEKFTKRKRFKPPTPVAECSDEYIARALESGADQVLCASEGSRNITLNRECFTLARFVVVGRLNQELLRHKLTTAALRNGLDEEEIGHTINSALRARGLGDAP